MIAYKKGKSMPEQPKYFDRYLEGRFRHLDESIDTLKNMFIELRQEVRQENEATRKETKEENETTRREVKAENRSTRWWIVGTAITVLVGFAAISVAIFFGFSQLQTSWIQSAFSLIGKAIK
jgi:type VI protein secretion system component VasF